MYRERLAPIPHSCVDKNRIFFSLWQYMWLALFHSTHINYFNRKKNRFFPVFFFPLWHIALRLLLLFFFRLSVVLCILNRTFLLVLLYKNTNTLNAEFTLSWDAFDSKLYSICWVLPQKCEFVKNSAVRRFDFVDDKRKTGINFMNAKKEDSFLKAKSTQTVWLLGNRLCMCHLQCTYSIEYYSIWMRMRMTNIVCLTHVWFK